MDKFFVFLAIVFGILLPTVGIVVVAVDGTSSIFLSPYGFVLGSLPWG